MARVTTPGQPTAPDDRKTVQVQLRVAPAVADAWRDTAAFHQQTLSVWMREHLNQAVKTKERALTPLALKNCLKIRSGLTELHGIINHIDMPEAGRKALLDRIERLREPVAFLTALNISEQ